MSADGILFCKMEEPPWRDGEYWPDLPVQLPSSLHRGAFLALEGEMSHGSWVFLPACQLLNAGDAGK